MAAKTDTPAQSNEARFAAYGESLGNFSESFSLRFGSASRKRAGQKDKQRRQYSMAHQERDAARDLLAAVGRRKFATVLADPPWRFVNRTGKMAPEHRRLSRYGTMTVDEISSLLVPKIMQPTAHLHLWVPNALLPKGIRVPQAWGFDYKSNIVWHRLRKDGGSDGRGGGFYFPNVTEVILFGVRGNNARTLAPG